MNHDLPNSNSDRQQSSQPPTQASLPARETDRNLPLPESIAQLGMKLGAIAGNTALDLGKAAIETAAGVSGAMSQTAMQTGKAVVETAIGVGGAVSQTTAQTGKVAIDTATAVGSILGHTTVHTSRAIVDVATWMGDVAMWAGEASAKQTYQWLEQATQSTGQAVTFAGNNSIVRRVSGVLKLDWLVGISDRVDLEKAAGAVRALQQKYPSESPSQLAHRIMIEKAVYAGGVGLVTSLVPGAALALLAVDLAATATIQTEMVYQIAAAYGMDLTDPARKGEVLAIFGLALGGSKALKLGLEFLQNAPVAGAMIGAGTNATMLYTLGYAACRFYEAKPAAAAAGEAESQTIDTLETLKQDSDRYLEMAIVQQAVVDQILVHMILASYPQKSWEDILPDLKRLQLSEASLESIAQHIQSPQPIDALLSRLNQDFAIPLLAQCYRIARQNGVSEAEQQVLESIAHRFRLNLEGLEQAIVAGKSLPEIG